VANGRQRRSSGRPRRGAARRRRTPWIAISLLTAGGIGVIVFFVHLFGGPGSSGDVGPTAFPYPCLSTEGTAQHVHPYLRIVVDGNDLTIPASVGIRDAGGAVCYEPVHTHDASGIVHIESVSPTQSYTLGDFFAIWRATYGTAAVGGATVPISYTVGDLMGRQVDARHDVRLLVDGKPSSAGPTLVLNALDYCTAAMTNPPCFPTAVGDPYPPFFAARYGTGHVIVLQYAAHGGS
jgi:hypothetical protein